MTTADELRDRLDDIALGRVSPLTCLNEYFKNVADLVEGAEYVLNSNTSLWGEVRAGLFVPLRNMKELSK